MTRCVISEQNDTANTELNPQCTLWLTCHLLYLKHSHTNIHIRIKSEHRMLLFKKYIFSLTSTCRLEISTNYGLTSEKKEDILLLNISRTHLPVSSTLFILYCTKYCTKYHAWLRLTAEGQPLSFFWITKSASNTDWHNVLDIVFFSYWLWSVYYLNMW